MNRFHNALEIGIVATILLAAASQALAQEESLTVQVVQVDESRFPEIDVYVSVTDADGEPVTDLKQENFRLEENGQRIRLADFSQAGEQGSITAVLVIDKSGSMDHAGKMEAARKAAVSFVGLMRPGDFTGVIAFDTEVTIIQPLTDDQETLVAAIESIETGSDTALYDALHAAADMLKEVSGRKAIIAVTDGMNTAGARTLDETLTMVDEEGVSVYTIGLGDPELGTSAYAGIDEETLQAIAQESNGIYQFAPDPEDLSDLYETLSYRLQNEYKLTYESPTPLRDGVKRDIVVSIVGTDGAAEVTADYNPGGVIPEVAPRSTWGLFAIMFVVLVALLAAPTVVGKAMALAGGGGGRAKPKAKGRVRLTGDTGASGRSGKKNRHR
jgi:Ca-activated chloride channel family protein